MKNGDLCQNQKTSSREQRLDQTFSIICSITRFQIRPGDRPDDVSQEVYETPTRLGGDVEITSSILEMSGPHSRAFDDYLMKKKGSEQNINQPITLKPLK